MIPIWITPRDIETLRESVLWAGGLSPIERDTLREMLAQWSALQALRDRDKVNRQRETQRETQGGKQ